VELYLHSPNKPSWCGSQLKHRDNFTFIFYCIVMGDDTWAYKIFLQAKLQAALEALLMTPLS